MSDEIKEIFIRMNDLIEHQFDKEYHTKCDLFKDIQGLLDYITNLQQRLEASQTNEETYRLEMQDITKCLGLKEDTLFDEVKEFATDLQQENDRLNNIVIEVRRYIEDIKGNYFKRYDDEVYKLCDEVLNILESKGEYND